MQVADMQNVIFLELIFSPITHEAAFLLSDCISLYPGSIPTSASTIRKPRRLTSAGFFFVGWKTPVPLKKYTQSQNPTHLDGLAMAPSRLV
jgi:hypothetical protein